ncbi:MAG: serine hydrolase domain-containing protein [Flavobacteriaceae bacterium]|nr:beta-lactamase family protein [Ignavibacteriota bacterium]
MIKNKATLYFLFFWGLIVSSFAQNDSSKIKSQLDLKIDSMRVAFNFPAVAYGVIRNDSIIALNVLGYRDIETKEKAQITDYFHIGSCTKSFTAFLAASLVEKDLIDWNTKFFDLYPELKEYSKPAYYTITLQELLSHRARMIAFKVDPEVGTLIAKYEKDSSEGLSNREKRYQLMKQLLQQEPRPVYEECEDHCYSNAGFVAAGMMLEKVANKSWEDLMLELSDNLNLDLRIGVPVDYSPSQPKGHINPKYWFLDIDKDLVPISDQLRMYHNFNQFGLLTAPGGNISMKTEKFLKYLSLHLQGLQGKDNYLKSETYQHIFTTFSTYSHGWWVDKIDGHVEYAHRGSNGTFYSFEGLFPKRNLGIVVMVNSYSENGLTEIIQEINEAYKEEIIEK